ncbi:inosine-5'-monophosphate dehydrogenase [Entophlyctis luteolus]|nr:inosine-5'-monophosphate dehydrogenase [Entophlyctis luteolus]
MALNCSIGFIYHNHSVAAEAEMVRQVKKFEDGLANRSFVPETFGLCTQKVLEIKKQFCFSGIPISTEGNMGGDIDFCKVPATSLVQTRKPGPFYSTPIQQGMLLIVDSNFNHTDLLARYDLIKTRYYPCASTSARHLVDAAQFLPTKKTRLVLRRL